MRSTVLPGSRIRVLSVISITRRRGSRPDTFQGLAYVTHDSWRIELAERDVH